MEVLYSGLRQGMENAMAIKDIKVGKPGIILMGILLGLTLVYAAGVWFFTGHFLPNTEINGSDYSYRDKEESTRGLEKELLAYTLTLENREGRALGEIQASDMGLKADVSNEVKALLESQPAYAWPMCFWGKRALDVERSVSFEEDATWALLETWDALKDANTVLPRDAYIGDYSGVSGQYTIIPEVEGTRIEAKRLREAVAEAIRTGQEVLNLAEASCYVEPAVRETDKLLAGRLETLNGWVGSEIIYDWNGALVKVDGDLISKWISSVDEPALDEDKIAEFVAVQASENDTYGKKRSFTTTAGTTLMLPSGAYGWKTDRAEESRELLELISRGERTKRSPVYSHEGAQKGKDDIGSSYVEIDLSGQHLYVYQNGSIVFESDLVSGNMSKGWGTPSGVFGLSYKTRNAVLRGEDYETPVNYWMPFNGNIGMHDATWRGSFGGDIFMTKGSHGCINLPKSAAASIYGIVSSGFPVVCYY